MTRQAVDIDAIMVGMGAALGSVGGFVCGRSYVMDHQVRDVIVAGVKWLVTSS